MDDEQASARTPDDSDAADTSEDVKVAPGGLMMGAMTAANMGSSTIGVLGAGVIGAEAASEYSGEDPAQNDALNLDALASFGSNKGETGDEGVSQAQKETEASEL